MFVGVEEVARPREVPYYFFADGEGELNAHRATTNGGELGPLFVSKVWPRDHAEPPTKKRNCGE